MTDEARNAIGELFVRRLAPENGSFLDVNNIQWKLVEGKWIGMRSVYCKDLTCKWLSEVQDRSVIRNWWCGEDADYNEIFERDDRPRVHR